MKASLSAASPLSFLPCLLASSPTTFTVCDQHCPPPTAASNQALLATHPMLCASASLFFLCAVAGLQGVREGLNLPPPVELDPGSLTDTQRRAAGIRQLPATLEEAIEAYDSDKGQ
jgi:hypothetical protein